MVSQTTHDSNKLKAVDEASPNRNVRRRYSEAPQYGDEIILVTVGEYDKKRTFALHKGLVLKHSQYFVSALNKDWKENAERHIKLTEDNSECFETFKHFIYKGAIFTSRENDAHMDSIGEPADHEWGRLVDCWLLGEKLQSSSFKDAITDAAIAKMVEERQHACNFYKFAYRGSAGPCGMRRLLVDVVIWKWTKESLSSSEHSEDLVHFFFDLSVAQHKLTEDGKADEAPYEKGETCIYHDHGEAACYKTMF